MKSSPKSLYFAGLRTIKFHLLTLHWQSMEELA